MFAEDHVVAEVLMALDDEVITIIAGVFVLHLLDHSTEDEDQVWDIDTMQCIIILHVAI